MKIDVIDYGVGNIASVLKALAAVDATPIRATSPDSIAGARALVIPGVGHFSATRALNDTWRQAIDTARSNGASVLGICLGMQWLFDGSAEDPSVAGLGAIGGTCVALTGSVKVPHVGWNSLERSRRPSRLLAGIDGSAFAYFTHSYAAPVCDATVATTTHGAGFSSVVERDRVFGVQWHPEKSGAVGLALLRNFVDASRSSSC